MIWFLVSFVALTAFLSLAVDMGRVQLAKTELQRAADAAARYAVTGLSDGTYVSKGQAAASDNTCDGTPIALLSSDIEPVTWSNGTFTTGGSSPNAIRITAYRAASRGTAIPLPFAQVLGMTSCDIHASAIALSNATVAQGIIGLGSILIDQSTVIDSYDASSGAYSAGSAQSKAVVESNGNISLSTGVNIMGNANPGAGGSVSGNGTVTGSTAPLSSPLNCPIPSAGSAATTNNNSNIPSTYLSGGNLTTGAGVTLTLPGGTYYFNSINLGATTTLTFTGVTTIYVNGAIMVGQSSVVSGLSNEPSNLVIEDVSSASPAVTINQSSTIYADLYAPQSTVVINKQTRWYGSMVGSTLHINQQSLIHCDQTKPAGVTTGSVSLVQ